MTTITALISGVLVEAYYQTLYYDSRLYYKWNKMIVTETLKMFWSYAKESEHTSHDMKQTKVKMIGRTGMFQTRETEITEDEKYVL